MIRPPHTHVLILTYGAGDPTNTPAGGETAPLSTEGAGNEPGAKEPTPNLEPPSGVSGAALQALYIPLRSLLQLLNKFSDVG